MPGSGRVYLADAPAQFELLEDDMVAIHYSCGGEKFHVVQSIANFAISGQAANQLRQDIRGRHPLKWFEKR